MTVLTVILRKGMTKNPICRRTRSGSPPFYVRDPRVPRRGQIRDRRRGRKQGACLRRRNRAPSSDAGETSAQRAVAGKVRSTCTGIARRRNCRPARGASRGVTAYSVRAVCAGRYLPQRAVAGRARSARTGIARRREYRPGRTLVRGVTGQRRESAERGGLTDGILACPGGVSLTLRMTPFSVILKRAALKNPGCRRTCSE